MATATMMRASAPSLRSSSSSARPSAAAHANQAPRISVSIAPGPHRQHAQRSRAVDAQAFYGRSGCQPCGPAVLMGPIGVRMVRPRSSLSQNFRQREPMMGPSVFDLLDNLASASNAPAPTDLASWLSSNFNAPHHAFNIQTFDDRYELTADTPGMGAEDVTVEVTPDGQMLRISGERKAFKEVKDEAGNVSRKSTTAYSFSRAFVLPEDAQQDGVSASLDKGVLTVSVPRKAPEPKPQPRRVNVTAKSPEAAQQPADPWADKSQSKAAEGGEDAEGAEQQ